MHAHTLGQVPMLSDSYCANTAYILVLKLSLPLSHTGLHLNFSRALELYFPQHLALGAQKIFIKVNEYLKSRVS